MGSAAFVLRGLVVVLLQNTVSWVERETMMSISLILHNNVSIASLFILLCSLNLIFSDWNIPRRLVFGQMSWLFAVFTIFFLVKHGQIGIIMQSRRWRFVPFLVWKHLHITSINICYCVYWIRYYRWRPWGHGWRSLAPNMRMIWVVTIACCRFAATVCVWGFDFKWAFLRIFQNKLLHFNAILHDVIFTVLTSHASRT